MGQLLGWFTTATVAQLANSTQALQTGDMLCLHTIIQTTVAAIHFSVTDATESQLVKELGQDRPVVEGGGRTGAQNDLNLDCLLLTSIAHHA